MKREGKRRLSIDKETLRRLTGDQLDQVAGGKIQIRCTYEVSGCAPPETHPCPTFVCETGQCTTGGNGTK